QQANPAGWKLTIAPRIGGYGTWLGTSTWMFHPDHGLQPSTRYTVTLAGGARDASGEPLGHTVRWSFRTVTPEVKNVAPRTGDRFTDPFAPVKITFNQPMNPASVARGF